MIKFIRETALKLKADCEAWDSPVPRPIRIALHTIGKHLYVATYGMTPKKVDAILEGRYTDPIEVIFANRIAKNYGATMRLDGTSYRCNFSEDVLFGMVAFDLMNGRWNRLLYPNGIHLERCECFEHEDIAERFDYPKGTKFYYIEPDDEES
ncbi:MAG: hypothetical protein AAGB19_05465 [Cyanobacteria bacterium P01_F01_bin.3]